MVPINFIVLIVIVIRGESFQFRCLEEQSICTLESWNPTEEGFYVLGHIPTTSGYALQLNNVKSSALGATFWHRVGHTADIRITNSATVRSMFVPGNCTVRSLTVEHTRISDVYFEENSHMHTVMIIRSHLREVIPTLLRLENLRLLKLRRGNINVLKLEHFCNRCENLHHLELDDNRINAIVSDGSVVCRSKLRQFLLRDNVLESVNLDHFAPFRHLTDFDVSFNRIKHFTGHLSNAALVYIGFASNRLRWLDFCDWDELPNLFELSVAYNNLTQVPGCMRRFTNVEMVYLQSNQITKLKPDDFSALIKLVLLNLSANKLSTVPFDVHVFPRNLVQLHLYQNCLCYLNVSDSMLNAMENLTIFLNKWNGNTFINEDADCNRC